MASLTGIYSRHIKKKEYMNNKIGLKNIPGFRTAALKAGIKASGNPDLGLIVADDYASCSAVFTQSRVSAAPVKISKKNMLKNKGKVKAVLVNAGNANACTGREGLQNAEASLKIVADGLSVKKENILICSTGIIGEQLPMNKLSCGISKALAMIEEKRSSHIFSKAIMTTDTVHKEIGTSFSIGKKNIKIAGTAKGVGMIAPNMATMLAFLLTDISVKPAVLRKILKDTAADTFNCVTVDGDTSTNDTCILLASGCAGNKIITSTTSKAALNFKSALRDVSYELARKIAADGEGATTMIQVLVKNAGSRNNALKAARSIAESPLVKTAVAGNDPNWGRIMMAAGKSGAFFKEENVSVTVGGIELFKKGAPLKFSARKAARAMSRKEVTIEVDMGMPKGEAEILTCDFTHGYIKINADYHT
jgi:glutamate N-acetyltransferase/amino-acid N-acetyltransferase